jgi:hypothetical protein
MFQKTGGLPYREVICPTNSPNFKARLNANPLKYFSGLTTNARAKTRTCTFNEARGDEKEYVRQ